MSVPGGSVVTARRTNSPAPTDGEVVEFSLLLPSWQAAALETAAQDQGLTTGQMVRHLIRDFFDHLHAFGPLHDCVPLEPGA
jgi:hypothetical protein